VAGKYAPSLDLAFRIAHAFEAPLEAVFTYDPDAEPGTTRRPRS
jgi:DNA-binding XRE family transcriptional regulator